MLCQCWNNDNFIQEQKPESYLHLTLSAFHDRVLAIYRKSNLPPPHLSAWWKSHTSDMYDAGSLHYITGRISATLSFTKAKSIQVAQFTATAVFAWFLISDIIYFMKSELRLWNFNGVMCDYPPSSGTQPTCRRSWPSVPLLRLQNIEMNLYLYWVQHAATTLQNL